MRAILFIKHYINTGKQSHATSCKKATIIMHAFKMLLLTDPKFHCSSFTTTFNWCCNKVPVKDQTATLY
jgi:hypothetical protein